MGRNIRWYWSWKTVLHRETLRRFICDFYCSIRIFSVGSYL